MAKKIITITRQYGSGGREIGETLAKRLGVSFWDNKLLDVAAKDSGIHKTHFEESDERRTNSFLYLLSTTYGQGGVPFDDALFFAQLNAIQKIASKESCLIIGRGGGHGPPGLNKMKSSLIIGRCADYALRDFNNVVNIYITAPLEDRINRAINAYGIGEKHAAEYVKRMDKQRISYYNYYTDKRWGVPENYELCLDSSALGIEGSVDLLEDFIKKYFKE